MIEKNLLFKGTIWASSGFAISQLMRLSSNLILTRLLFPEVFGLMALVQVVMVGVKMFSDMGIATSVLRDKAGDDPVLDLQKIIHICEELIRQEKARPPEPVMPENTTHGDGEIRKHERL